MATAIPQDYVESLQEYIVNNIDDPNPSRSNSGHPETGGWVFNTEPQFDLNVYPRIHINTVNDQFETFEIGRDNDSGKIRVENNGRIQITIVTSTEKSYYLDIDGDGENERPERVLDFLKSEIVDAIKNNQDRWRDLGDDSLSLLPESARNTRTDENRSKSKVIDARIKNIR